MTARDDAWRYRLLADALPVTTGWPPEAIAAFHRAIDVAPPRWRPDGDDDHERAANARALARAFLPAWRAARPVPPVVPGPRPWRPVPRGPVPAPPIAVPAAEQAALGAYVDLLGVDLGLLAWRTRR